jgi:hypothetical protein
MSIRKDLRSKDQATRRAATVALDFLREWGDEPDSPLWPSSSAVRPEEPREEDVFWSGSRAAQIITRSERVEANPWLDPDNDTDIVPSIENPVAGWTNVPRQRMSIDDRDSEEAQARRRRREAMVLHEGEDEVREGDIIRPRR